MKRKNLTYFITLQSQSAVSPAPIPQKQWDKLLSCLSDLLHPHNAPLELCGQKHQGSILMDTNAVSFSPVNTNDGGDFTLKRVGSKILIRIKSKSDAYDTLVGACLLAVKKHLGATVSQTGGIQAWDAAIRYFQYAADASAPIVYPAQARKVTIDFEWDSSAPAEDCGAMLEDIRALLAGTAKDISIRFDKPE